jgi:tetratricopeptide (TPR) repeat protein
MQQQTIRTALGQLQSDPEEPRAWQSLDEAVTLENGDLEEALRLLSAARQEHLKRREWDAVARLLATEVQLSSGSERELERLRLEAKVLRDNLLDEGRACRLFERILELDPRDRDAAVALEESRGKRNSWQQLVDTYQAEADKAADDVYRSSMSMRAAEVELRFAADQVDRRRVLERLTRALQLDSHNERAAEMLELLQRRQLQRRRRGAGSAARRRREPRHARGCGRARSAGSEAPSA